MQKNRRGKIFPSAKCESENFKTGFFGIFQLSKVGAPYVHHVYTMMYTMLSPYFPSGSPCTPCISYMKRVREKREKREEGSMYMHARIIA